MLAIKIAEVEYLPRQASMRAAMYADMPYGSHYTNERFQTKNGPAIAVVGAIGSISTGVAMGGFLGGVMIAGGIASAIGAISGNEMLSNIGMGMSLVGGLGGAFTNAAGDFVNPFTNFGETNLGSAFGKMGDSVKNFFGDVTGQSEALNAIAGDAGTIATDVVDSTVPNITQSSFTQDAVSALGNGPTGVDLSAKVGTGLAPAATSSGGGGLLNSLLGNKDLLNVASGVADAYDSYKVREQQQPLIDSTVDLREAQTDAQRFETDLANKRYNNMQNQRVPTVGVNPNAQVYGNSPVEGSPKVAVVMNGEVKYMTTDEYAAYKQQQQPGGGLLSQGATA